MKKQARVYTLPEFWLSPLFYGDYSSMSEKEVDDLTQWMHENNPGHPVLYSAESNFCTYHDAKMFVLACDCVEITFLKQV